MDILIKSKQSGFGIIEVVIAATLMSVVSLGIAKVITSQAQQVSYMEDRMSHLNFKSEMQAMLGQSPESCKTSLDGKVLKTAGGKTSIIIKDKDDNVIFDPADPNKNSYDKIKIINAYIQDVDTHSGGSGEGEVNIVIEPQRLRKGGGPTDMAPVIIKQRVAIDGSNNVTDCLSGSAEELQCALRDLDERGASDPAYDHRISGYYPPTGTRTQTYKLPSDVTIVRLDLRRSASNHSRCDNDYTCPASNLLHTIYPGVTKIGGYTFPKGATLTRKHIHYRTVDHETCSGNGSGHKGHYRIEYFYGSVKLASTEMSHGTKIRNCTYVTDHKPILNTNTMPPFCPVTSGRAVASIPYSLGFEIYTSQE